MSDKLPTEVAETCKRVIDGKVCGRPLNSPEHLWGGEWSIKHEFTAVNRLADIRKTLAILENTLSILRKELENL